MMVSFAMQKIFIVIRSQLLIVDHGARTIGVKLRKSSVSMIPRLVPVFSSFRFSVPDSMSTLIHLGYIFVWCDKYRSIYIIDLFYTESFSLPSTICSWCYFFPICFWLFFFNQKLCFYGCVDLCLCLQFD